MRELGRRLASVLTAGDLVILSGGLGAGKTTLTQGIGDGLGVRGPITSPTFVIARVHPPLAASAAGGNGAAGRGPALVHADAYRLGSVLELDDLDLDTDTASSVTVVEWGEGLAEGLSADRLEITIAPVAALGRDVRGGARTAATATRTGRWDGTAPTGRARCGYPRSASAGKASSCPSSVSLIVYSSALYSSDRLQPPLRLVSRSPTPHRRHAVTQHGSFPGRPRGRRARHQADVPEGEGYAAPPQDEREFPDLSPIRPRDARPRDGRGPGDWPGQQAQPGQYGPHGRGGQPGPGGDGGGYPAGRRRPGSSRNPAAPATAGGASPAAVRTAEWPAGRPPGRGQAHWPVRTASQAPGQPGGQSAQPSRPAASSAEQAQPQWADAQQARQEEDVPSWAEPDSVEAFSARWHRRGLDSRDDRRSGRRKRRRLLIAGGGAVAVVIAVAVYFLTGSSGNSANLGLGSLVTQFLPGEVQSVPDACNTVPSATLSQYLPGTPKQAAPPLNSGTDTQCTWTLDNAPTYRVLEVQIEAYTPSALVANSNGTGLVPPATAARPTRPRRPSPRTSTASQSGGEERAADGHDRRPIRHARRQRHVRLPGHPGVQRERARPPTWRPSSSATATSSSPWW